MDELSTKGEVAEGGFEFEASPRSIVMPNRKREEKGKVQLKLLILSLSIFNLTLLIGVNSNKFYSDFKFNLLAAASVSASRRNVIVYKNIPASP